MADEIKFAESGSPTVNTTNTNVYINGHISASPEISISNDKSFTHGQIELNAPSHPSNVICGTSTTHHGLQNGTPYISTESSHKNLSDQKPEILHLVSEKSQPEDSSNCQPAPVISDSAQGPRPDLIPTSAGTSGTAASFAACHDTHNQNSHAPTIMQGETNNSVPVQNENVVMNNALQETGSHLEQKTSETETTNLEVPGSDGGSKENLSIDISQPSTISSVASSMSSTISPKHMAKEETRCDIDQVDSGISVHSLKADERSGTLSFDNMSHKPDRLVNVKPVGFGDVDDDMTEENIDEELEAYLSGMEISPNVHRGTQPDISDMVKNAGQIQALQSAPAKVAPKTLNLTEINKPSMALPVTAPTGVELRTAIISSDASASVQKDSSVSVKKTDSKKEESPERRQSAESVEKFLAQAIMSPGISTPMEDAGFSRVPGYTPVDSMATLAEELEEPEAFKLALEGENKHDVSHSNNVAVNSDIEQQLELSGSVQDSVQSVDENKGNSGECVSEMPPQTSKSATGVGARPKDLSQMNRKSRPNSLLGLSTPDISIQRPLVMSSEDGVESGPVPTQPSPVLSGVNPGVQNMDSTDMQFAQNRVPSLPRDNLTLDIKNQFDTNQFNQRKVDNTAGEQAGFGDIMSPEQHMESVYAGHTPHQPHPPPYAPPQSLAFPLPGQAQIIPADDPSGLNLNQELPDNQQLDPNKQKRPTSLSLLPRGELPPPNVRPKLPEDAFQGPVQDSDSSGMYTVLNL